MSDLEGTSLGTPAARRRREQCGDDVIEDVRERAFGRRPDLITGTAYLEYGKPVRVITRWRPGSGGPRNVLVERADGSRVVRPFRGLRRPR